MRTLSDSWPGSALLDGSWHSNGAMKLLFRRRRPRMVTNRSTVKRSVGTVICAAEGCSTRSVCDSITGHYIAKLRLPLAHLVHAAPCLVLSAVVFGRLYSGHLSRAIPESALARHCFLLSSNMGKSERPEHIAPPEIFYNSEEARKYTTNSRIMQIQVGAVANSSDQTACLMYCSTMTALHILHK